jgi:hypothetical protein
MIDIFNGSDQAMPAGTKGIVSDLCRDARHTAAALAIGLLGVFSGTVAAQPMVPVYQDDNQSIFTVFSGAKDNGLGQYELGVIVIYEKPQSNARASTHRKMVSRIMVDCQQNRIQQTISLYYSGIDFKQEVAKDMSPSPWSNGYTPLASTVLGGVCIRTKAPQPRIADSDQALEPTPEARTCRMEKRTEITPFMENVCDYNAYGPLNCRNVRTRDSVYVTDVNVCD